MREIKFRAWDCQKQKWADNNEVSESVGLMFGTKDYFVNKAGERMLRWHFMQFTGLLDKNGKEIYEGDILKNVVYGGCFVVEWGIPNESYAGWTIKWLGKGDNRDLMYYNETLVNCEIIGNIYENPDRIPA